MTLPTRNDWERAWHYWAIAKAPKPKPAEGKSPGYLPPRLGWNEKL